MTDTIQALQIVRFGGPEVLQIRETPKAGLSPDSIRVQVKAAGVNFADIMMRIGAYPEAPKPPFTPGYEISGVVTEVGKGVTSFAVGDRVLAGTRFGGYTNEIVLPESQAQKIPDALSDAEAAAIPVNFLTAWLGLSEMGRVRKGDRVLVQSAAGGVGTAAVQIAAQAGAHVVGLVGSPKKADVVRSLGAAEVLTNEEWDSGSDREHGGFDVILDSVGGASLKRSYRRLAPAGRVITFGVSSAISGEKRALSKFLSLFANTAIFTPFQLMMANKGVFGLNLLKVFEPTPEGKPPKLLVSGLEFLMRGFEEKRFKAIVGKTFPLSEGGAAHTYLQSRANIGKVILLP